MSQESISKSMRKNLISPLTHDELWGQFLDAFSYEIYNIREKFGDIKKIYDIYSNSKDDVVEIARTFGYDSNLIINNTLFMAKKEAESIPYHIKKKTTYDGYYMTLQQNGLIGEVFNYYCNGDKKLVKAINYNKTKENLTNSDHCSPFCGIVPIKNYSEFLNSDTIVLDYLENGQIIFDDDGLRKFSLDQKSFSPYWKLDKPYIKKPTKHLGLEYFPQHYWCEYHTNLGIAIEEVNEYSTFLRMFDLYLHGSMSILINEKELELTITESNGKEWYSDSEGILDESNSWYDFESGKITLTFNIVPIGHEIIIAYGVNLLMSSDHLYCLEEGMEYNKRCPIVPHTGLFLTADIFQQKGSDFIRQNKNGYTVEDLKLKAITAASYNKDVTTSDQMRLDNAKNEQGQPSGEDNFELDSSTKWYLDVSETAKDVLPNFKYIAYGNGALPIYNQKNVSIFNTKNLYFYYNLNSEDDSEFIYDMSKNNINCVVNGNKIKIDGIISKSLNFDGTVSAQSETQFAYSSSKNYTFGIWFLADAEKENGIGTLFDNFITISYDYENETLNLGNEIEIACSKGEPHFLCFTLDDSNLMTAYLDNELKNSETVSLTPTSKPIRIGAELNDGDFFYGLIDNLWLTTYIMNENEMTYVYENKITLISHMGNRMAYYELSSDETYSDEDYLIVQSYVKTMDVVHEIPLVNQSESDVYSSKTNFKPILNSHFNLKYFPQNWVSEDDAIIVSANEKGDLYPVNESEYSISSKVGHVDVETGEWYLTKNKIESKTQQSPSGLKLTKHEYNAIYIKTPESTHVPEIYTSYIPSSDTFENQIQADEIDASAAQKTNINVYMSKDDNTVPLYSENEGETYYIHHVDDPTVTYLFVLMKTVSNDEDGTKLFANTDYPDLLYSNLTKLNSSLQQSDDEKEYLRSFVDLGEYSSTTLYTTQDLANASNPSTFHAYLNVKCSNDKEITKWSITVNGEQKMAYKLGTIGTQYYSDLLLNSELSPDPNTIPTQISFNPMQTKIVSEDADFDVELTETRTFYECPPGIYGISTYDYIVNELDDKQITDTLLSLVKGSPILYYWLSENETITKYQGRITENGKVTGHGIDSDLSTFDYDTNLITIVLNPDVKIVKNILVSYEYYESLSIDIDKPIVINYKIDKIVKINEIGLEDENHNLMAYMTFPDIEPNDIYNNVSAMFAINKN